MTGRWRRCRTASSRRRTPCSGRSSSDLEARIAEVEAADVGGTAADGEMAGELRDALRLGRLLLSGTEVTL